MVMYQLTYISTATPHVTDGDIDDILCASRLNNRRNGVTGLLIFDGRRFLQALEGDKHAVDAAFLRIKGDPRHRAAVMLALRETDRLQFGAWDMACERANRVDSKLSLAETVDALVANVPDANTRALFSGFARIIRPAAA
jgi:hypothetical protein